MIKVVHISETSPSEIIEHVNAHGILAIHGGRLVVRNALNQADDLAASESSNKTSPQNSTKIHPKWTKSTSQKQL